MAGAVSPSGKEMEEVNEGEGISVCLVMGTGPGEEQGREIAQRPCSAFRLSFFLTFPPSMDTALEIV